MEEDLNNFNFNFPSKVLKPEDFSPVESSILKDYYRNSFLKIIDKVRNYFIKKNCIFYQNRLEQISQKNYL